MMKHARAITMGPIGFLALVIGLWTFAGAGPLGAAPTYAQVPDSAVVARVNGVPITAARFESTYLERLIHSGRNDTPDERLLHLEALIDMYLLAEEARARGLEGAAYDAYMDRRIKATVGSRYFAVALLDTLPEPTEAELRAAFLNSRDRVAVRHLLYPSREAAEAAHARLRRGADFVALANEAFDTPAYDSTAGYLGHAGYWELADAFAEAAYTLDVGAYSEPVRTRYGWHIVRVEERILDPLPTESGYQYQRQYVRSQTRQRRLRLEGDRFVRTFMEGLDVDVNEPALRALQTIIREAVETPGAASARRPVLAAEEVASIRGDLEAETALATYSLDGYTYTFTAGDYARWLPELPGSEVRNRTAASVGRALRNEALAQAGLARGLEADPRVVEEVRYHAARYLAGALRDTLRHEPAGDEPTEAELRTGFDLLGYAKLQAATATYWQIPFASAGEGETALQQIIAGEREAASFAGYVQHQDADLLARDALRSHVRRAPLETPLLIGTGDDGWFVVSVQQRTLERTSFDEARPALEDALRPELPALRLLRRLRGQRHIEVDHALFERMFDLAAGG